MWLRVLDYQILPQIFLPCSDYITIIEVLTHVSTCKTFKYFVALIHNRIFSYSCFFDGLRGWLQPDFPFVPPWWWDHSASKSFFAISSGWFWCWRIWDRRFLLLRSASFNLSLRSSYLLLHLLDLSYHYLPQMMPLPLPHPFLSTKLLTIKKFFLSPKNG